jgi:carbon catabolite-derepressing protein kinase
MEVMLEIYRTLKTLGFEWKKKRPAGGGAGTESDGDAAGGGDDPKQRKRREEERAKAAIELFYIETRCTVDDVIVRMDIQ